MKLLIIRHGDPDYSIDSLTAAGWREAELLSKRLGTMGISKLYCSPLGRARDTAAATEALLGQQAQILPWLREFAPRVHKPFPPEPSCAWDWLPQDWVAEPRFFDKDRWLEPPVFQQSGVPEDAAWVVQGIDDLLADHGYVRDGLLYRVRQPNEDVIALFCHFGVECVILGRILNISPMQLWHGTCAAPTAVTVLNTEERREGIGYFRMATFGDTSHLYAGGVEPAFAARFCELYRNLDQRHD